MDEKIFAKEDNPGARLDCLWDNPWFMAPILLFFAVGLSVPLLFTYGEEIIRLNGWRKEPWNTIFPIVTHLGEVIAFVVTGLAALLFRYRITLLVLIVGLLTIPVSYISKDLIGRDRPITYFEANGYRGKVVLVPDVRLNTGRTSFPSGHTMAAFALYATLAAAVGRQQVILGLLFALAAISTGFSRIFLVQHFVTDVLAGAVIGLLLAWIVIQINNRFFPARWTTLDLGLLSSS